jgi:DNA-binding MarR family transcriptional regulator
MKPLERQRNVEVWFGAMSSTLTVKVDFAMTVPADDHDIPGLLRGARGSYAQTISARLTAASYDDLPRNGVFVLAGMGNWGGSVADVISGLEVTKQAASQLIDTLVLRGYLTRDVHPDDRRRMVIDLTERGRGAAAAIREAVLEVDAMLTSMISAEDMAGLRVGLAALAEIKERTRPTD